jgi:BON domain
MNRNHRTENKSRTAQRDIRQGRQSRSSREHQRDNLRSRGPDRGEREYASGPQGWRDEYRAWPNHGEGGLGAKPPTRPNALATRGERKHWEHGYEQGRHFIGSRECESHAFEALDYAGSSDLGPDEASPDESRFRNYERGDADRHPGVSSHNEGFRSDEWDETPPWMRSSGRRQWGRTGFDPKFVPRIVESFRAEYIGKGPKGYRRSDERIREEICDYLSLGYLDASDIEVDVHEGVAHLRGTVSDKYQKRLAEDIAESCRGVIRVDNDIRVQLKAEEPREGSLLGR